MRLMKIISFIKEKWINFHPALEKADAKPINVICHAGQGCRYKFTIKKLLRYEENRKSKIWRSFGQKNYIGCLNFRDSRDE